MTVGHQPAGRAPQQSARQATVHASLGNVLAENLDVQAGPLRG